MFPSIVHACRVAIEYNCKEILEDILTYIATVPRRKLLPMYIAR